MPDNPPIGVIGVGWVGLVTAGCFAELGHEVWCRDIDPAKLASLRDAKVPIHEPGLQEVVAHNAARLHFEDELAPVLEHARLLFVCVDTPPTYSGDADLSRVEAVVDELPDSSEHAIVMKSTVPCGTGASIRRRLGELGKGSLGYAANPEFLQEGSAVRDFMNPDRVVIGSEAPSDRVEEALARLYEPLGSPIVRTDVASAEMIKLASNAFLATKISFINEIANVCEELGADVSEVAAGMGLDPRIGQSFLRAGIGYGGSCFPKDVSALKQLAGNSGYHFQLLTAVIEVNELQKRRVVNKLKRHLGSLIGKRIALLGLAFKPNTDDMREASSIVLAARLQAEGAIVRAYDPVAEDAAREMMTGVEMCDSAMEALEGVNAAVIVTEWPEFAELDLAAVREQMADPVIVDGRNILSAEAVHARGPGVRRDREDVGPMQALVLAGGEGTRLRPLTNTIPKPVIPLANRPFLGYMIEWLAAHGFTEVILSCMFLAGDIRRVLGEEWKGTRLHYVEEPEPRGTAGAVKFAEAVLDERFAVLNGDILTDFDISALWRRHEELGARGTITLMEVQDPSAYGLVLRDPEDRVTDFIEKPQQAPRGRRIRECRRVRAGARRARPGRRRSRGVLRARGVPGARRQRALRPSREGLLAGHRNAGPVSRGHALPGGAPPDRRRAAGRGMRDRAGREHRAAVGAGDLCEVEAGAVVERGVLFDRAHVERDAVVRDSVVGTAHDRRRCEARAGNACRRRCTRRAGRGTGGRARRALTWSGGAANT